MGDVGGINLVVVGLGEGLASRIKNYLFLKNVKIGVDDCFYMIYV